MPCQTLAFKEAGGKTENKLAQMLARILIVRCRYNRYSNKRDKQLPTYEASNECPRRFQELSKNFPEIPGSETGAGKHDILIITAASGATTGCVVFRPVCWKIKKLLNQNTLVLLVKTGIS